MLFPIISLVSFQEFVQLRKAWRFINAMGCWMNQGSTCIVNAASERDMAVFAAGMIQVLLLLWYILLCPQKC